MVGNRYDNFYGYTGLFPILPSTGDGSSPSRDLRRVLSELPNGPGSLFSRTGLVHGARLFVLSDVVYNGHPSKLEHLRHQYLVLSMTFDGSLEPLLARVAERGLEAWRSVFAHTWGFPDPLDRKSLTAHVQAAQVTTTFLYVDAEADLDRTLHALAVQKELFEMVTEGQGKETAARRALVRDTLRRIDALGPVTPGSLTRGGDRGA